MLDLARDPRWGRTTEAYGEDPYLVTQYGLAQVRGIQGEHVVSTLKHFAVYSIPKGGRDGEARTDPQATWREIQELYLAPFRAAVRDAGALGGDGLVQRLRRRPRRGQPALPHRNPPRRIRVQGLRRLRQRRRRVHPHQAPRRLPRAAEAIRQSVDAGLNIHTNFTPPEAYGEPLRQLVRDGKLPMATIDARVRDILRVKYWLDLFDSPYRDPAAAIALFADPAAAAPARAPPASPSFSSRTRPTRSRSTARS